MARVLAGMLASLMLLLAGAVPAWAQPRGPLVLAAASLQESLNAAADGWVRKGHPRPVISFAGRHTIQPFEVGGYRIPKGRLIGLSAGLTHYDPNLFERPDLFNPERFVGVNPGTYEWIPFGGGRRRCIGATFAHMELDVVLRVILERVRFLPTDAPDERWEFKGVAWSPAGGGMARIEKRAARPAEAVEAKAAA